MAAAGPGKNVVIAISDVIQHGLTSQLGVQAGVVNWYWRANTVVNGGITLGELATGFENLYAPAMKVLLTNNATWRGTRIQRVVPKPVSAFAYDIGNQGPGTGGAEPLPKQIAAVITWYTDFGGRMFRGRSYIPFASETNNDPNGIPNAAYVANLTTLMNARLGDRTIVGLNGSVTFSPIIFHRKTSTSNPLNSGRANARWGTQRRRGDYGQQNPVPF